MAIFGIDQNKEFEEIVEPAFEMYKQLIDDLFSIAGINENQLRIFSRHIVNLILLKGLTEEETIIRDDYVDKFLSLIEFAIILKQKGHSLR